MLTRTIHILRPILCLALLSLGACVAPTPAFRAPPPVPVGLRLVHKDLVPFPQKDVPVEYAALAGPGDELWLFAGAHGLAGGPQAAHRVEGRWGSWEPLAEPRWRSAAGLAVEPDADGRPVVIWPGRHHPTELTGQSLAETVATAQPDLELLSVHWTGEAWSSPVAIDRWRGFSGFGHVLSLRDTHNRIHVAYHQPLDPPEHYAVGFLVVDGVSPGKCAHVVFDGQNWSKPVFTTGRERFDLRPLTLSEGPAGLVLACEVYDFWGLFPATHLGYQVFDGRSWRGLTRVVSDARLSTSVTADFWGNRLVTYGTWTPRNNRHGDPATMYLEGAIGIRRTPPPEAACESPLVTTDAAGRIALLSPTGQGQASLRVWNGAEWSPALAGLPGGPWVSFGRSHSADRLLILDREGEGLATYEIAVEQLSLEHAASGPNGDSDRLGQ